MGEWAPSIASGIRLTSPPFRGFFPRVRRLSRFRRTGALALVGVLWLAPAAASPSPSSDERAIAALEQDTSHGAVVGEPLRKARQALTRARSMEQAGDLAHASVVRATAREWIEVARDLVRANDLSDEATKVEKALDELETKTVRGRALLEETAARRGRARETLEQLQREPPPLLEAAGKKARAPKGAPRQPAGALGPPSSAPLPGAGSGDPAPKAPPSAGSPGIPEHHP